MMLRVMAKRPLGRLAASDHAMRARAEMFALDEAFEALMEKAHTETPAWDVLRALGAPGHEQVIGVFGVIGNKPLRKD